MRPLRPLARLIVCSRRTDARKRRRALPATRSESCAASEHHHRPEATPVRPQGRWGCSPVKKGLPKPRLEILNTRKTSHTLQHWPVDENNRTGRHHEEPMQDEEPMRKPDCKWVPAAAQPAALPADHCPPLPPLSPSPGEASRAGIRCQRKAGSAQRAARGLMSATHAWGNGWVLVRLCCLAVLVGHGSGSGGSLCAEEPFLELEIERVPAVFSPDDEALIIVATVVAGHCGTLQALSLIHI